MQATVEYLCSSYQYNILPYGAHSENYVLDALLSCILQQMLVHRHTHLAQFRLRSLRTHHTVSRHAYEPVYIHTYFLLHLLLVLLIIFVTFPLLVPLANPFVAYSTERLVDILFN